MHRALTRVLVAAALCAGCRANTAPAAGAATAPAAAEQAAAEQAAAEQAAAEQAAAEQAAAEQAAAEQAAAEARGVEGAPAYTQEPPAGAEKTASGLVTQLLKPGGGGAHPEAQDAARVRFTGWNAKGKLFDSSKKQGGPATFELDSVIPGLAEGLALMTVGEQRRLWIPDHLGYPGRPGAPRGMMVFDLELLEIVEGKAPVPAPPDVVAPPADATRTESGLVYRLLHEGGGAERPHAWDRVTLRYTGWTTDGAMFDSSQELETPPSFELTQVMPGWREGLQRIAVGDRARLWIPEALAYRGRQGPPRGTVVFDVELVAIERRPEPPRAPDDVASAPKQAKRTPSGLAYRMLARGEGARPTASSRVEVHYSGWTTDGELFDSSVVRGKPATFRLGSVIPGWREGLQEMRVGGKALLWVPEKLAYGGKPGAPRGTLVYELELLRILN